MSAPTPDTSADPPRALAGLATGILLVAAVACVAELALAITRVRRGLPPDQVLVFYLLPLAALGSLVGLLRLSATMRVNAALALVATAIGVLMAETALSFAPAAGGEEEGPSLSTMDVVTSLRSRGTAAFPRVPGNVLVNLDAVLELPDGSVHPVSPAPALAAIVLCVDDGKAVVYDADEMGFNNPPGSWAPDSVEVALIGDSYTQGVCVDSPHQIASHLRPRWSVMNLGAVGAGPLQELAILREYASTVRPEVVVWIYNEGNDLWDMERETDREWLLAYLDPDHTQRLVPRAAAVGESYGDWLDSITAEDPQTQAIPEVSVVETITQIPRLRNLRNLVGIGVSFPSRGSPLGALPEVLSRAEAEVRAWGGQFVLVYLPAYSHYGTFVGEQHQGRSEILEFARRSGIPLIDLDEVFAGTGDPRSMWTRPTGHLGTTGYRIAGQAIADGIASLTSGR